MIKKQRLGLKQMGAYSVALHGLLLLYLFAVSWPPHSPMGEEPLAEQGQSQDQEPVVVSLLPALSDYVVESEEAEESELKEKPQGQVFLGEKDQIVGENQRASSVGAFKKGTKEEAAEPAWKDLSMSQLGIGAPDASPPPSEVGGEMGASDDFVPGAKLGQSTLLNTREYAHFGFMRRVKQLVRHHWKFEIDRAMERFKKLKREVEPGVATTVLIVQLSESGEVREVRKVNTSGYTEIDSAARTAFQRAGRFPNPPEALIAKGEGVSLKWTFILHLNSSTARSKELKVRPTRTDRLL